LRVVVVDGHPVMRLGLRTLLEAQEDIRVVGECSGGGEALRLVEEGGPDLVVLDLNLIEGPDGIEVCRRTKALPDAPYVLIYTAYNLTEDVSSLMLPRADSYLYKHRNGEALLDAVRRTAAGEKVKETRQRAGGPGSVVRAAPEGARLTPRELEVLALKLRRRTNAEIAAALHISLNTVKHHVTSSYKKLEKSRKDLLRP
jgi:DNA-binding NarL/FixJ family response regulator